MKNSIIKRTISTLAAGFLAITAIPNVAKEAPAKAAITLQTTPSDTQKTGTVNGYHHEIWQADTPNSSTMTLADSGGGFTTSWKCGPNGSRGNFLARRGLYYGRNTGKHWQDHGNFTCQFDCEWSAGSSGNSRICIYGWTENPLVEYYIIEDWKNWVPSSSNAKQATIDGSSYDIFTNAMNSYNITGTNGPFTQYISVRKNRRTSGTISIYKHFETWESMGMKMGDFYEVAFNVEGWESDGQANVKKNIITTGKIPDPTDGPTEPVTEPSDGVYFNETFESGAGKFEGRGAASVTTDSKNYYSGSKSLFVSGRTDYWHGAAITLDSSKFKPGQTYSLSTAVLQKSGSPVDIKFTMQQGSGNSAEYHEIATVNAKSGEWTKVENTSFTIPSGSSDLVLYVEAPDSYTDFYIDDVLAAVKGKSSSVVTGKGTVDSSTVVTPDPYISTDTGLKNVFAKYFRIGTAVTDGEVTSHKDFVLKHFNSITPENQLKPQWIFDASASAQRGNNVNPQVKLPSDTKTILDFAVKYNIPVRGHTLIWHSQTPTEFFRQNFSSNGAYVSKDIMNQRIDNWIKNVFDMLNKNYPTLRLYAYDVANECFADGYSGLRAAGDGGENSPWTKIYGDDSFLETAFTSARKYAPKGCKLFYNDYNEYEDNKINNIYNLCKKLYSKGILDGVGMQSHLDTTYPSLSKYQKALDLFSSIGCEIHVTELDVTAKSSNGATEASQATYYESIVKAIKNCDKVTSLTFWGTNDNMSWRRGDKPLIFNSSYQPKQAYNKIVALVPESDWLPTYIGDEQPTTKATDPTTEPPTEEDPFDKVTLWGDANCSGDVKMNDAVLVMQVVANEDYYGLNGSERTHISEIGYLNADVCEAGNGITTKDALTIQKYLIGSVKELPESYSAEKKTNVTNTTKVPTFITTTTTPKTVDAIKESFDSSTGDWSGRGDASVSLDSKSYYDGSKSLLVSGRTDNWHGAAMALDSSKFKAGNTYSFSAAVMQPSTTEEDIQLTLQYNDASGTETYAQIASASAKGRTWTKLENTSYTIPEGATDLLIYFEMPKSLSDFYVDSVLIGNEGTKSAVTTGSGKVEEFKTPEPGSFPDPSKPMIGISFDDGASPSNNKRIVDALAKQGFTATFFYVSDWAQSSDGKNEIKYAYSKGMEIANHTMSHPRLGQKSANEIRQEADGCHNYLKSVLGVEPSKLLRLPYLDGSGAVKSTLSDYGLVSCAIDTQDYNKVPTSSIVNTIKQAMADGSGNGAVVLMHETEANTVAAIEELAPYIKAQGWQIVSISEMYAAKGKSIPKNGQIITRVY